jgi:hypothetical protein
MGQGLWGIPSSGSGSSSGEIESMLSGLGGLNRDHELGGHVQQNSGLKDPGTAWQYTQQGVEVLDERSRSNPQGLQSLLGGFLGGGGSSIKQQGKGGGAGLGEMLGDVLGKQALYLFCVYFLLFWKQNDN